MRIINRHMKKLHVLFIGFIILIPGAFLGYMGLKVLNIYQDMGNYMIDCGPADPETFLKGNYTKLSEMAQVYDELFEEYHIPLNCAVPITWNESFTEVQQYHGDEGDGLIWTGTALAGQCFRYKAAQTEIEREQALAVVKKLLEGISMCLIVPNGGLGPEFPGVIARYWGDPNHKDITPHLFSDDWDPSEESFYNGTGDYSNYRYAAHTSNDQHAGFYLGIGMALKYVAPYESDVKELVTQMIDQKCGYVIQNDFLIMDGNGGTDGAEQKRNKILGSIFGLAVLKLGAIAVPEKYEELYYYYLLNDLYIETISLNGMTEALTSYYALNFDFEIWLTLLLLEENTKIQGKLFSIFESSIWQTVKWHRNVWFNLIYLATGNKTDQYLEADIEDQFMRFDISHFPDRRYTQPELPEEEYQFIEGPRIYNHYFQNSTYGGFYAQFFTMVGIEEDKLHTNKPLTVEYREMDHFIWQRSPFRYNNNTYSNPRYEQIGISFTTPYWLARAFGYLGDSGISNKTEGLINE